MSCRIAGLGTAVPEHFIEQMEAAILAQEFYEDGHDHHRVVNAIYRRTGVRSRHSVVLSASTNCSPASQAFYDPASSQDDRGPSTADRMAVYEAKITPLALRAALAAIRDSHVPTTQISHLVTVSCTGFSAPGFDHALIRDLGLPAHVQRTNIGFMGCHGALNGIRVAKAFIEATPDATVLLCAAELCSLHQQYGFQPDRIVSNALFADGAAALVLTGDDDAAATWRFSDSGSTIIPDTVDLMGWTVRDHGFEMSLSPKVPDVILRNLRHWLDEWLAKSGLSAQEIHGWAIHPGGPKILQACQDALDLESELLSPSRNVLSDFGNMSSPTVLFILERLRRKTTTPLPCVLLGFGPGLSIEAALVR